MTGSRRNAIYLPSAVGAKTDHAHAEGHCRCSVVRMSKSLWLLSSTLVRHVLARVALRVDRAFQWRHCHDKRHIFRDLQYIHDS